MVTHRKPHRPASRDSVTCWLKQKILLSGVKPGVFGAIAIGEFLRVLPKGLT